jgi:hypothetical protein
VRRLVLLTRMMGRLMRRLMRRLMGGVAGNDFGSLIGQENRSVALIAELSVYRL